MQLVSSGGSPGSEEGTFGPIAWQRVRLGHGLSTLEGALSTKLHACPVVRHVACTARQTD